MSGFVIHHYNIIDRTRVDELGPLTLPIAKNYGAEVVVGSPVKALKGNTYSHMEIYQLASFQAALEFYHSPEFQALDEMRGEIIEGFSAVLPGHAETEEVVKSGYFDQLI